HALRERKRLRGGPYFDARTRVDDEQLVRLLHGQVPDRIAEIVAAGRVDGGLRLDGGLALEARLLRMQARLEMQHVMRDRHDLFVIERGLVANLVEHASDPAAAGSADARRRRMAEETLRDMVGELVHVALDAPQQPIEVDARVEANDAVAELDRVCELELALQSRHEALVR